MTISTLLATLALGLSAGGATSGSESPSTPPAPAAPTPELAGSGAAQQAEAEKQSLWTRLRFSADGRVRGESTFDQLNGEDRHRGRLRLRVGGEYDIHEKVRAGARLTTLSDGRDANNPHWDFGDGEDGFSGAELGLDRLYLDWRAAEKLTLSGGKFGHVYTRPPVTRELAWDDDVQPAGVAAVWAPKREGDIDYDLRAIYAVAQEINASDGSGADPAMAGIQANLYLKLGDATKAQLASSYSDWSSLGNFSEFPGSGNTAAAEGFAIWDSYLALTFGGKDGPPLTAFGQYLDNLDDESGEDSGYALGLQYGRTSGKGNANAFGAWYSLDANSVFAPVAQDDTPVAGTGVGEGMDGVVLGAQYFVTDNFSIRLWGLSSDVDRDEDPYRIRLDFEFRVR